MGRNMRQSQSHSHSWPRPHPRPQTTGKPCLHLNLQLLLHPARLTVQTEIFCTAAQETPLLPTTRSFSPSLSSLSFTRVLPHPLPFIDVPGALDTGVGRPHTLKPRCRLCSFVYTSHTTCTRSFLFTRPTKRHFSDGPLTRIHVLRCLRCSLSAEHQSRSTTICPPTAKSDHPRYAKWKETDGAIHTEAVGRASVSETSWETHSRWPPYPLLL